jgi:hypothetical protein
MNFRALSSPATVLADYAKSQKNGENPRQSHKLGLTMDQLVDQAGRPDS